MIQMEHDKTALKDGNKSQQELLLHEALHTAYLMTEMVCTHLVEHEAIKSDAELSQRAQLAADALADLYQAICTRRSD